MVRMIVTMKPRAKETLHVCLATATTVFFLRYKLRLIAEEILTLDKNKPVQVQQQAIQTVFLVSGFGTR